MSTNKTPNLNLHSWVAEDPVKMSEFNENFAAIDTDSGATWDAIEALQNGGLQIAYGSYSGTGSAGSGNRNTLNFSFAPKLVIVAHNSASGADGVMIMVRGQSTVSSCGSNGSGGCSCIWSGTGVTWYATSSTNNVVNQMNMSGHSYYYVAIG